MARRPDPAPGPFTADQVRPKDRYELSQGHPLYCAPTGSRGSEAQGLGFLAIATDPAVDRAGVDTGYSPAPGTLRAPDVSVIPGEASPGWVPGVPPLAVEYADVGQDESALREKIGELLEAGTQAVWVVRLNGPRVVEEHRPGLPMREHTHEGRLEAPGVLSRPVPVAALYDREAARAVALDNLLERFGYQSVEDIHAEGRVEGLAEGREDGLARGLDVGRAMGKEEGREEGLALGLEVGRAKGREEGRAEGREEGRAEGREEGLRAAARTLATTRGLALTEADLRLLESGDAAALEALVAALAVR